MALKQGRKKCSKHGCDRGTSTVLPTQLTGTNGARFVSLLLYSGVSCDPPKGNGRRPQRNRHERSKMQLKYLTSLATVSIASRAKLLNYTTMVQHFLLKEAMKALDGKKNHGSTLPWHPTTAHGCLHARSLSANAQPQ